MRLIDADALYETLVTGDIRETHQFCYPCKKVLGAIDAQPTVEPQRKPGKTLAEEVERIKREITDIFAEQIGTQPEPLKIHLDPELTKEEIERLMRIGDSPVIPPDRQEITVKSAVGFLQSIGWMQEHDKHMYKQGYKHGKSKGIKRGMAMARRKEAGGD